MFVFQTNECIHISYLQTFFPSNIKKWIQQEHSFTKEQTKSLEFGGFACVNHKAEIKLGPGDQSSSLLWQCLRNGNSPFLPTSFYANLLPVILGMTRILNVNFYFIHFKNYSGSCPCVRPSVLFFLRNWNFLPPNAALYLSQPSPMGGQGLSEQFNRATSKKFAPIHPRWRHC